MTTTATGRATDILAAYLALDRQADPAATFAQLAERVPGLTFDDIVAAADLAKRISSALRGLAWRVQTAAADERRRNAPRR
jgi:hypothetical protein